MERNGNRKTALLEPLKLSLAQAERSLAQHYLLDKAWQFVQDICDQHGRHEEAEAVARKRIAFQGTAYSGLSGTRAWTLEAYADMLLRHWGASIDPAIQVPSEEAARHLAP